MEPDKEVQHCSSHLKLHVECQGLVLLKIKININAKIIVEVK